MVGLPAAIVQPLSGDWSARNVAERQPVKLAAMEGHLRTGPAAFVIGGWPNAETLEHTGALEIPGALSLLLHGDPAAIVQGLDAVAPADRPPVAIVHTAFQIMIACGTAMAGLACWGLFRYWRRKRGHGVPLPDDRRFLTAVMLAAPLGVIALEAGWTVTEVGRQPWSVQGFMRTADAVTPMPGLMYPFVLFTLLYIGLAITVVFLLWRQLLKTGVTKTSMGHTGEMPIPRIVSTTRNA